MFCKTSQNSKEILGSGHLEVLYQKILLKILQNSQKTIFPGIPFLIKLQAGNVKLSEAATGDVQ